MKESAGDHLVPLENGWAIWRDVVLRGAGFSVGCLDSLVAVDTVAAIARQDDVEALAASRRSETIEALLDLEREADDNRRLECRRAFRRATKRRAPRLSGDPAVDSATAAFRDACAVVDAAAQAVSAAFTADEAREIEALRDQASRPRFREAVAWQNRNALRTGLAHLATKSGSRGKLLSRATLAARYLMRYSAKNETIGFFGPVGWGTVSRVSKTEWAPSDELLAARTVYFEHWAIDAMAAAIGQLPGIRPLLAPRLLPTFRLEAPRSLFASGKKIEVSELVVDLLGRCKGRESARDIAARLIEKEALEIESPEEIFDLLEQLADKGVILWALELPSGVRGPERALASLARSLDDPTIRQRALAMVGALSDGREQLSRASGDDVQVDRALGALEETFLATTGRPATRRSGEAYAGRTLVYEDCRRAGTLCFGKELVDALASPLYLIALSARWYTHEIARRYRAELHRIYRELAESADASVDFIAFWTRAGELFPAGAAEPSSIVSEVQVELDAHWSALFGGGERLSPVTVSSAELRGAVEEIFAAPMPGWPTARHLSPDVLVAALDVSAIREGELAVVLGELHIGNTTMSPCFFEQHPTPETLLSWQDRDIPAGVCPVEAKDLVLRTDRVSYSDRDTHLELGPSRSWKPPEKTLRAADLTVEARAGSLEVVDRRSGRSFDIIAFLDQYLTFASSSQFRLTGGSGTRSRVTIDNLVVIRQQWFFQASELAFGPIKDRGARFVAAHAWWKEQGLPRRVFAKASDERKPVFVDIAAPMCVDMLAQYCRRGAAVALSEMLPDTDQAWLTDAAGRHYTSELRLIMLDPAPWTDPRTE